MSHLPTERLAALADEQPTSEELAHLASCAPCARERAAYQSLLAAMQSEHARIGVPLTSWDALRPALVDDGVIDDGGPWASAMRRRASRRARALLQVAAALLLVAGGMAAGRLSTGDPPFPGLGEVAAERGRTATPSRFAAVAALDSIQFTTIEDARQARQISELLYQRAATFLAENDSTLDPESPATIRRRLAALDRVDEVMREALSDAPYDPVINGYYLTTSGQREAALRQLNTALPENVRIINY